MSLKITDTDVRPKISLKFSTKGIILYLCLLLKRVLKCLTYTVKGHAINNHVFICVFHSLGLGLH